MASLSSEGSTKDSETLKELLKQRPRIQKKQQAAKISKCNSNPCWNQEDLKKLEKCVSILGTDFDLIQLLFKNRTRKQIMNKYKKAKIQYDRKHKEKFLRIQDALKKEQEVQRHRLGSIDSIDLNIALDIHELSTKKE
ncbi:unnamed protein product (macronuclear) [Paramecium tetraurelia]|uniref:SANT domain-containing protein n=1 Tax=Paramecium tetraurelia TaxID=5888 RepID=A0CJG0_PARTE|nr:uncharacterized protein GSPATT00000638001 [Paramecium tetraurelia]CAK70927.1 unnamed protein product [Paramecium tetraurelia]|eukprot:XP_001438324.1 hypothetical protein (macronuclear) [Paramecium tetraurelia strain d4-2]